MSGLTREQLAAIHVAKQTLQLDDDVYRDVLQSAAGVRSARDLTAATFRSVMARFEELGYVNPRPRRKVNPRVQHATPLGNTVTGAQQALIAHLFSQLGMDSLARQRGFNQRTCGQPWPQTRAAANKVIEGLKRMAERGYVAGPDRT